jgi:hypothetical protein
MSTNFGDGIPLPPDSRAIRRKPILRVGLCLVVFVVLFISSIILLYLFTKKSHPSTNGTTNNSPTPNEDQFDEIPIDSKNLVKIFYVRKDMRSSTGDVQS